jgi:hypothetical protein
MQPCLQFLEADRLYDEIVSSSVQALHLFLPTAARRQDHDRQPVALPSPQPQQIHARAIGQIEIEHDSRDFVEIGPIFALLIAVCHIHGEARLAQSPAQPRCQLYVVFYEKQTQALSSNPHRMPCDPKLTSCCQLGVA